MTRPETKYNEEILDELFADSDRVSDTEINACYARIGVHLFNLDISRSLSVLNQLLDNSTSLYRDDDKIRQILTDIHKIVDALESKKGNGLFASFVALFTHTQEQGVESSSAAPMPRPYLGDANL